MQLTPIRIKLRGRCAHVMDRPSAEQHLAWHDAGIPHQSMEQPSGVRAILCTAAELQYCMTPVNRAVAAACTNCCMLHTFTTSKGPVASGPRQAAEKPDPMDCTMVSWRPSPSCAQSPLFSRQMIFVKAARFTHHQHTMLLWCTAMLDHSHEWMFVQTDDAVPGLAKRTSLPQSMRSKLFLAQNKHI